MNLICGINPVLEALVAGARQFDRLLVAKGVRNRRVAEAIRRATELGIPLRFEGRQALDQVAGGVNHQGIIAVVSAKSVLDLESFMTQARDPALVVVLDGVEDPRNLGAIVRTIEAAGADGVVLPERHCAPLSETVSRASAGALDHVRVARVGNLSQAIEALKARGCWVVGFDASGSDRWHVPDYRRSVALVFGGEGRGIRRLVRETCDQIVSLPLFGQVGSLNVSVAAGVALYEVIRQRGFIPSHVRPIPVRAAARTRQIIGPGAEDLEDDPGRIEPLPEGPHEGNGDLEGGEQAPHTISVIDLHEEVGWARRVSANVEGGRPLPSRRHAEDGASERGGAAEGDRGPHPRRGERQRRRRWGSQRPPRPEGAPPGKPPVAGDDSRQAEPVGGEAPRPETPNDAAGRPQRRRRRRRRRR